MYIKATEGLDYKDPAFSSHYTGATDAGFIRGGYHFAHGDESASDQVKFFAENGGGWTNDGITLPGMLDLEGDCASVEWIQDFSNEYHSQTGRYPVLYSSPSWWSSCTGNSDAFVKTSSLDMACWDSPLVHLRDRGHTIRSGNTMMTTSSKHLFEIAKLGWETNA